MENAFYIVACRFHVREKDRLLITGIFWKTDRMETGLRSGWMVRKCFIQWMEFVFTQ